VITASPDLSSKCAEFALPSICLSTFAICDQKLQRPRKICRDECEILENDVCQSGKGMERHLKFSTTFNWIFVSNQSCKSIL
jgi:hypothetical protein